VWSARFAGVAASDQENLEYLLRELKDVPQAQRRARYQCVIVLVRSGEDPAPLVAHGSWEGRIAAAARGSGGFGYDPVFVPTGDARSAAQLSPAEKNAVSHRGQALRALLAGLRAAGVYFRP
jgi:XTP/dITP diphosphohydrolase